RLLDRQPSAIGPIRGHRVEGVDDGHEACKCGDLVSGQLIGIPATVPALVVVADDGQDDFKAGSVSIRAAPLTVCDFMCSNSSGVSRPVLRRTLSSTPILPMSCNGAPMRRCWRSVSDRFIPSASNRA